MLSIVIIQSVEKSLTQQVIENQNVNDVNDLCPWYVDPGTAQKASLECWVLLECYASITSVNPVARVLQNLPVYAPTPYLVGIVRCPRCSMRCTDVQNFDVASSAETAKEFMNVGLGFDETQYGE